MSRSQQTKSQPKDENYIFAGGRYKGFSVKEVLEVNAQYILWIAANTDLDFVHTVIEAAEDTPTQT
jgi:hypothetical protein